MSVIPTETPRILLVEDDRAVHGPIEMLLKHYGFSVSVATDLRQAREQLKQKHNLMVLDLTLPDGTGLELLQELRFKGADICVFVLTGNTNAEVDRKLRRLVPSKHFRKPFNFYEILESIRNKFPQELAAAA